MTKILRCLSTLCVVWIWPHDSLGVNYWMFSSCKLFWRGGNQRLIDKYYVFLVCLQYSHYTRSPNPQQRSWNLIMKLVKTIDCTQPWFFRANSTHISSQLSFPYLWTFSASSPLGSSTGMSIRYLYKTMLYTVFLMGEQGTA